MAFNYGKFKTGVEGALQTERLTVDVIIMAKTWKQSFKRAAVWGRECTAYQKMRRLDYESQLELMQNHLTYALCIMIAA